MFALYENENEYQQHSHAIHSLANRYQIKEALVREIYEVILKDLLKTAKFRKYVLILATRNAKKLLCKLALSNYSE